MTPEVVLKVSDKELSSHASHPFKGKKEALRWACQLAGCNSKAVPQCLFDATRGARILHLWLPHVFLLMVILHARHGSNPDSGSAKGLLFRRGGGGGGGCSLVKLLSGSNVIKSEFGSLVDLEVDRKRHKSGATAQLLYH